MNHTEFPVLAEIITTKRAAEKCFCRSQWWTTPHPVAPNHGVQFVHKIFPSDCNGFNHNQLHFNLRLRPVCKIHCSTSASVKAVKAKHLLG